MIPEKRKGFDDTMEKTVIEGSERVCRLNWKVCYYETDAMGVVHHSNYFRWMEAARCAYLDEMGLNFRAMEQEGITSPVTHVEADYRRPALFDDEVEIAVRISYYDGLRLSFSYEIRRGEELLLTGLTKHCFTRVGGGRVLSLSRTRPDMDLKVRAFLEGRANGENGEGEDSSIQNLA